MNNLVKKKGGILTCIPSPWIKVTNFMVNGKPILQIL